MGCAPHCQARRPGSAGSGAQVQAPQSSSSSLGMGPTVDPPVRQPYAAAGGDAGASALQPGGALSASAAPAPGAWGAVKPKPLPVPLPAPASASAPGPAALMPASLAAPGTPTHHAAGALGAHHNHNHTAAAAPTPQQAAPLAASAAVPVPGGGPAGMSTITSAAAQIGGSYHSEGKAAERVILPPQVWRRLSARPACNASPRARGSTGSKHCGAYCVFAYARTRLTAAIYGRLWAQRAAGCYAAADSRRARRAARRCAAASRATCGCSLAT